MQTKEIVIGLVGLADPPWGEDFFPEDLPSDWRFAFLTNEIRALLLTDADLLVLPDDAEEWSDEVDDGFCYLHTGIGELDKIGEALAEEGADVMRLAGLNHCWTPESRLADAQVGVATMESDPSPAQMRQWVEQFMKDSPGFERLFLLFDGKGAAFAVREARVLVELMGY